MPDGREPRSRSAARSPARSAALERDVSPERRVSFEQLGRDTIEIEAHALKALVAQIDDNFRLGCELILEVEGRVVVVGMGKSGHIGGKIAATLASTGTPAFFVHPGEASHGDLGMLMPQDLVLAISNSGETEEI